jgi:hypothetical protein
METPGLTQLPVLHTFFTKECLLQQLVEQLVQQVQQEIQGRIQSLLPGG